jgi:hypothetical protein
MRQFVSCALLAVTAVGCFHSDAPVDIDPQTVEVAGGRAGLWAIPECQWRDPARLHCLTPAPFYFDGETVTLRLYRMKAWEWESADGYYRVRTKWVGEDLYWLPPFGRWENYRTFRDGHFETEVGGFTWRYEKVRPDQVTDELRPLLKKREKHDYSIAPDGSRDPERLKGLD